MALGQAFSWSASWSSWLQGNCKKDDDTVTVQAFARCKAIPWSETPKELPVLVRVTAPPRRAEETIPRAGVDVVAVLDISNSMKGERMERMKQAMLIVIDKLGPDDRLSIVAFDANVQRLTDLTDMSDKGRDEARPKINELTTGQNNNMGAALQEGAEILRARGEEKSSSRLGCIMFLSDGEDEVIYTQDISPEFPVHTFGLGADHDPKVMKHIADKTSGTYSFVNQDIEKIKDAFALFIAGLTSVAATAVKITLETHHGVTISSIESGGYSNDVSSNKRSGTIKVDNIYAGEQKNFIVYLTVAKGKKKLLTVGGSYQNLNASKQLGGAGVLVLRRPLWACSQDQLAIHQEVAAELARIRLEKGVSELAGNPSGDVLQQLWDGIKDSEEGRGAPKETLSELDKDVAEMKKDIGNPDEHKKSGLPYMLSWLSCHKWQRATTKGALPKEEDSVQDPPTSPLEKGRTLSFGSLLLLVLAAALLYLAVAGVTLMLGLGTGDKGATISGNATLLDISQHPGWPKMEQDLELMFREQTETLNYSSDASRDVMNHAMNRYLYQAIAHAAVLESRYAGKPAPAGGQKVGRREVEAYLRLMLNTMQDVEITSAEENSAEFSAMNRYLYLTLVQGSVLLSKFPETEIVEGQTPGESFTVMENQTWSWSTTSVHKIWSWSTEKIVRSWSQVSTVLASRHIAELEMKLQEKNDMVVRIEQQLKEKVETVVRIEQQLQYKETLVATLQSEIAISNRQLDNCAQRAAQSDAKLQTCAHTVHRLEAKITALQGSLLDGTTTRSE